MSEIKLINQEYINGHIEQDRDIISAHDIDGKFIYISPQMKDILGYEEEELFGKSVYEFFHQEDIKDINLIINTVKSTSKVLTVQIRIKRKNGSFNRVEIEFKRVLINDEIGDQVFYFIKDITMKEALKNQLIETQNQFKIMFEHSAIGVVLVGCDGKPIRSNKVFQDLLGYSNKELYNMKFNEFTHPEDIDIDLILFNECLSGIRSNFQIEKRYLTKEKKIIWCKVKVSVVYGDSSNQVIKYCVAMIEDITEQRKFEYALDIEREKYKSLVEDSLVGVYTIQNNKFIYVNSVVEEITGYSKEELYKMKFIDLFKKEYQDLVLSNIDEKLKNRNKPLKNVYEIVNKVGTNVSIEITSKASIEDGKLTITGTVIDITERKLAAERINKMAYFDAITGLPNKYRLEEYAVNLIKRSKKFAILFVDLDQFKFINDKRGHSFGDLLLHVVGQKLLSLSNTTMMVSRYSDDKFVIIKPFEGKKEIDNFANAISSAFIDPLEVDGQEIYITPSTGISLYPLNAMNFETLYKQADTAMYAAKKQGENKFEYYSTLLNDSLKQKAELDYALRKAIINNEFTLHYQPQYNLLSGEIKGVEALIRWQNKNVKFSSPQEFIPFAEETGLILPIGDWVLRRACEEFKLLAKKYNITLSVNVSAVQLQQVNFIDKIKKTIKHTGFDPSLLTLELTESTMLKDRRIPQKLNEIRKIGVKISIDDFGTGYSSLSVLKEYPVNAVKIDRSFIKDATNDYKSKAMVKTIIDIADNLNFEIVAEGIEEVSQVELLKKLNCINGQGYLYCRPNDIKEIMKTIELNKNQNHSDNF